MDLFGNDTNKLKEFMEAHFDFSVFKKAGLYPKELKRKDYEGQAKIICNRLGLDSIYDYTKIGRGEYCHISYANPTPFTRFLEPIGEPLMKVEGKTAKVVNIKNNGST